MKAGLKLPLSSSLLFAPHNCCLFPLLFDIVASHSLAGLLAVSRAIPATLRMLMQVLIIMLMSVLITMLM